MVRICRFLFAPLLGALIGASAYAEPPNFTVASGDETFRLADARGRFVALHYLPKGECADCRRTIAEAVRRGPEVAGVVHVFIKPDSEDAVRMWAERLKADGVSATIFPDANGEVAKQLELPPAYASDDHAADEPALVLLDPKGNECFRYVDGASADRLSFDRFAREVAGCAVNPAVEQYNLSSGSPAIQGYDPVAYVDAGQAQPGDSKRVSSYRGVTYRFATAQNREKFATDPDKYLPAYGGWCATAMADGRKVDIDPENFKVTNGRLFLFYKGWLGDARKDWNKDERTLTKQADGAWQKIAPGDSIAKE